MICKGTALKNLAKSLKKKCAEALFNKNVTGSLLENFLIFPSKFTLQNSL